MAAGQLASEKYIIMDRECYPNEGRSTKNK